MAKGKGGADVLVKIGGDISEFQNSLGGLLSEVQGSIAKLNPVVALVSAAVLGIGASAVHVAEEYEKASNIIHVGTNAVGEALKGLEEDFRQVFLDVPQDAATVAQAIADINTRLGLTGKPLQDLTKQFLDLADLTGGDVSQSIREVTRLFGDWGVATADQSKTLDFLYRVSQNTGISVETLSAQMVQFGAPLRQMGFDMETAALTLAKFETEGVNAELVMGSLRIALTKMAKEGVQDSGAALEQLTQKIKDAGSAGEANAIAVQVFGARAGPDMAAAIREGRFEISEMVDALGDYEGAIEKSDAQTETLGERFGILWKHVQDLLEPIGRLIVFIGELLVTSIQLALKEISGFATVINKVFHGDFKGAMSSANGLLEDYDKAIERTREDLNKMMKSTVDNTAAVTSHAKAQAATTKAVEAGTLALGRSKKETAELTKAHKEHEAQLKKVEQATKHWKDTVAKTDAEERAKRAAQDLKEEHERTERAARDLEDEFQRLRSEMVLVGGTASELDSVLAAMPSALTGLEGSVSSLRLETWETEKALKALGVTPQAELDALAQNAERNFSTIKNSGTASAGDIDRAWVAMMTARKTALENAGQELPAAEQAMLDRMLAAQQNHKTASHGVFTEWAEGVKSITGHLGTDTLTALFSGDGFGGIVDKLKTIGQSFEDVFITQAGAALDNLINRGIKWAMNALDDLIGKLIGQNGVSSALSSVFGSVTPGFNGGSIPGLGGDGVSPSTIGSLPIPGLGGLGGGAASTASTAGSSAFNWGTSLATGGITGLVSGLIGGAMDAIMRKGADDRLDNIANDTRFLAWVFDAGEARVKIHQIAHWGEVMVNDLIPYMQRRLEAIQWPVEQLIDRMNDGVLPKLDALIANVPIVNTYVTLDGQAIAANVETRLEYGARLGTPA